MPVVVRRAFIAAVNVILDEGIAFVRVRFACILTKLSLIAIGAVFWHKLNAFFVNIIRTVITLKSLLEQATKQLLAVLTHSRSRIRMNLKRVRNFNTCSCACAAPVGAVSANGAWHMLKMEMMKKKSS